MVESVVVVFAAELALVALSVEDQEPSLQKEPQRPLPAPALRTPPHPPSLKTPQKPPFQDQLQLPFPAIAPILPKILKRGGTTSDHAVIAADISHEDPRELKGRQGLRSPAINQPIGPLLRGLRDLRKAVPERDPPQNHASARNHRAKRLLLSPIGLLETLQAEQRLNTRGPRQPLEQFPPIAQHEPFPLPIGRDQTQAQQLPGQPATGPEIAVLRAGHLAALNRCVDACRYQDRHRDQGPAVRPPGKTQVYARFRQAPWRRPGQSP